MHPQLNIALMAAREASKIIIRQFDRLNTLTVHEKSPNSYVSEIDRQAEAAIVETLRSYYPDHGIYAEESGTVLGNPDAYWLIDPLDGTTNYLHGFPHFSISIAFVLQGRVHQGLVYDPLRDELFTATRGQGAYLNNRKIRVKPLRNLHFALLGTGFPFKNPDELAGYLDIFKTLFPKVSDIRRAGSAALDLAYVAAGRLDGFWESHLQPWDIAAGLLLVQEAGGLLADFQGEEPTLERGEVIAGSPFVFKELLKTVKLIQNRQK